MEYKNKALIDLIKDYSKNIYNQDHPFLLFDLANVKENDHTKVLQSILKYDNCRFLRSFLEYIGAPKLKKIIDKPNRQKPAIGSNGTGFIDLYLEYKSDNSQDIKEKFIIENKIYDATDTKRQLERYIATALINEDEFKTDGFDWETWNNNHPGKLNHIHVVYLTSDGSKTPSNDSLPAFFGKTNDDGIFEANIINYYPITFAHDILSWLEYEVLPKVPYSDDGITIAGIRQYIASLKGLFANNGNSIAVNNYVNKMKVNDLSKYKKIIEDIKTIKSNVKKESNTNDESEFAKINLSNLPIHTMIADMQAAANNIFIKDLGELGNEWKLHITSSYIILFRRLWHELDTRKYSIPSVYYYTKFDNFLKVLNKETRANKLKWELRVDHLDNNTLSDSSINPFIWTQKNRTASLHLDWLVGGYPNLSNDSRKNYYKELIKTLMVYTSLVDVVGMKIHDKNDQKKPNEILKYLLKAINKYKDLISHHDLDNKNEEERSKIFSDTISELLQINYFSPKQKRK